MKKHLLITAFLGFATCYVAAQSDNSAVNSTVTDTVVDNKTIVKPPEDESSSSLLSDFLLFLAGKNKDNLKRHRHSENSQWYNETYFGYGYVIGSMNGNAADLAKSYSIDFGLKYRYQVSRIYSFTVSFGFLHNRYKIKNGITNNVFGNASISFDGSKNYTINDERFRTWALSVGIGNRFYFDKPHRSTLYLEVGAYGSYAYSQKYLALAQNNINPQISMHLKYNDSSLFNSFEAGIKTSLGMFNWIEIQMHYRFTDWFYAKNTSATLPPIVIGLGIRL